VLLPLLLLQPWPALLCGLQNRTTNRLGSANRCWHGPVAQTTTAAAAVQASACHMCRPYLFLYVLCTSLGKRCCVLPEVAAHFVLFATGHLAQQVAADATLAQKQQHVM
jgi:hypothetical protein